MSVERFASPAWAAASREGGDRRERQEWQHGCGKGCDEGDPNEGQGEWGERGGGENGSRVFWRMHRPSHLLHPSCK